LIWSWWLEYKGGACAPLFFDKNPHFLSTRHGVGQCTGFAGSGFSVFCGEDFSQVFGQYLINWLLQKSIFIYPQNLWITLWIKVVVNALTW